MFEPSATRNRVKVWWREMPSPVRALVGVSLAFCVLTFGLAVAASLIGRAPDGLSYDGSPVSSVGGVWAVFAGVLLATVLMLCRHWLAWLILVASFTIALLVSSFDVAGTVRQTAVIVVLLLPGTRRYFGVPRKARDTPVSRCRIPC